MGRVEKVIAFYFLFQLPNNLIGLSSTEGYFFDTLHQAMLISKLLFRHLTIAYKHLESAKISPTTMIACMIISRFVRMTVM